LRPLFHYLTVRHGRAGKIWLVGMLDVNCDRSLADASHQNAVAIVQDFRATAATMAMCAAVVAIVDFEKFADFHLRFLYCLKPGGSCDRRA
jgi:hypothetical protein